MPAWSEIEDAARAKGASEAAISVLRQKYDAGAYGGGNQAQAGSGSMAGAFTKGLIRGLPGGILAQSMGQEKSANYQQEVDSRAAQMAEHDANHPIQGAIAAPVAGLAAAGDTLTSGYASRLAGSLIPGMTAETGSATVDALRKQYPVSTFVGDLYGGAKSPIVQGAGNVGGGVAGLIGQNIERLSGGALGRYAANSFLVRAGRASLSNITAGAAAGGAYEATHGQYGADFQRRLTSTIDAVTSPVNVALSTGIGAVGANLQIRQSERARKLAPIIQRYEAITGQKLPVSVYTDNQEAHRMMDAMARIPELADDVAKVREGVFSGMKQFGRAITERLLGTTVGPRRNPAEIIREGQGTAVSEQAGKGSFTTRRQAIQDRFLRRHGQKGVDEPIVRQLTDMYEWLVRERKGREAPEIDDMFESLAMERRNLTPGYSSPPTPQKVDALEAIRKQLASMKDLRPGDVVVSSPSNLERQTYEAKIMYGAVLEAMNQAVPTHFDRMNRISKYLHRIEEAFQNVPVNEVDDKMVGGFWSNPNILTAWRGQKERGLPIDTEALRGEYLFRALNELVVPETGMLNEKKLNKALRSSGIFNRQVMEEVIPGLSQELRDLAKLSEIIRPSFGAEGAKTAGRVAAMAGQVSKMAQIGSFLVGLFTNPYNGISTALGIGGIRQASKQYYRSMISGTGQQMLQDMSRTGVVPHVYAPQGAAQAAGGMTSLQEAGTSAFNQAGDAVTGTLNYFSGAMNTPERRKNAER